MAFSYAYIKAFNFSISDISIKINAIALQKNCFTSIKVSNNNRLQFVSRKASRNIITEEFYVEESFLSDKMLKKRNV